MNNKNNAANANLARKRFDQYLIIGGTPKSGTTSLFRYLADHPQICPANYKETYFFAREFDLKKVCEEDETLVAFESYFSHCHSQDRFRLEGTPYTLYSKGVAHKIITLIPNATMLFILRDPVERFVSDYRFHVQRRHPGAGGTLEEFIEKQLQKSGDLPNLLQLGCYIKYLRDFLDAFKPGKIIIMLFEDLKANPTKEMQKLCLALGINAKFYANYRFDPHNQTIDVRYDWLNRASINLEPVIAALRARVMHDPKLHRTFENMVDAGKSIYRVLNNRGAKVKEFSSFKAGDFLTDYYWNDNQALSKELGSSLPWKSFKSRSELF